MNPHVSFEGDLRYTGSVTLDCEFRGSVVTDDQLVVGPSARVEAEITAGNVEIAGKVHGNIHAKSRVKLLAGGELYGDVESPAFSIDEGVVFEGHCTRPQVAPRTGAQASAGADLVRVLAGADDLLATAADAKSASGSSRDAEFGT